MNNHETASFFQRLKSGMEDSIAHSRGELTLKTTTLPLPPLPAEPAKVIALRKKLKMSQAIFAAALNVSTKLVQSWEQGLRKPDRGDLRLIEILGKQPELVSALIMGDEPARDRAKKSAKARPVSRKKANAA